MFRLTLDPTTGKATIDGISIETVEGLAEALAQQTARIEHLELLRKEDKEKLDSMLQDVADLQSAVNQLQAEKTPAPTPTPAPYVLIDRTNWTATGSDVNSADIWVAPVAAIDAEEFNRYLSQKNQYPGMWLEFNFNALISIRQIEIIWDGNHWARNFKLIPSDGQNYGSPIFSGAGVSPEVSPAQKIQFPVVQCRKIRLEIIEPFGNWLSIRQFYVYS
jgi:hypothetical protein